MVTKAEQAGRRTMTLSIPKPKNLRGRKVKTPFGMCEILCVNSQREVVFVVETLAARKYLEKSNLIRAETLPKFGY
jgi:hypothetical protein